MIASIPYHLAEDVQGFVREMGKCAEAMDPGRPRRLAPHAPHLHRFEALIVPRQVREYMRECHAWIGLHMVIGQATLFAKVRV